MWANHDCDGDRDQSLLTALAGASDGPNRWGMETILLLYSPWSPVGLALTILALAAAGCGQRGGSVAQLSGQVTLGGKPLPEAAQAFVTFASDADPKRAVSVPIMAGRYDSPATPIGPCRVFFEITTSGPEQISERTGQPYRDIINLVPAKHADGISLQVLESKPDQHFDLAD